jgi:hypothetical protein
MAGAANRQEFGDAFHYAENDRFQEDHVKTPL